MPDLYAYTDGACSGNPGPGGWGALLVARDGDKVVKTRELSGGSMAGKHAAGKPPPKNP
jgi:ribonuclease HI